MARETVARFIARISFFEREETSVVTSTRDAVDVVLAWLIERDFAHTIVTQPGFAIGVFITLGTNRQRVNFLTHGGL